MTERGRRDLARTAERLAIGPSNLSWADGILTISIDETTVPFPKRIRGQVRVRPLVTTGHQYNLDPNGRHRWWPIAPFADVEVALDEPGIAWSGKGYVDANLGDVPLEQDFSSWDWARGTVADETVIVYDVNCRNGKKREFVMSVDKDGNVHGVPILAKTVLPRTAWRIARGARADAGAASRVVRTLEDTPFYARSQIATRWFGQPVEAIQESLSLDRFDKRWVQTLLPFRMPRSIG
jgi:carotenoid 1,2-hydratase